MMFIKYFAGKDFAESVVKLIKRENVSGRLDSHDTGLTPLSESILSEL